MILHIYLYYRSEFLLRFKSTCHFWLLTWKAYYSHKSCHVLVIFMKLYYVWRKMKPVVALWGLGISIKCNTWKDPFCFVLQQLRNVNFEAAAVFKNASCWIRTTTNIRMWNQTTLTLRNKTWNSLWVMLTTDFLNLLKSKTTIKNKNPQKISKRPQDACRQVGQQTEDWKVFCTF